MLPQKILKFSFSKMRIWRILRENYRTEPKLTVKIACVYQQIDICFSTVLVMDILKKLVFKRKLQIFWRFKTFRNISMLHLNFNIPFPH